MLDVVDDGGPAVALYDRLGWRMVDRRLADWTTSDGRAPTANPALCGPGPAVRCAVTGSPCGPASGRDGPRWTPSR